MIPAESCTPRSQRKDLLHKPPCCFCSPCRPLNRESHMVHRVLSCRRAHRDGPGHDRKSPQSDPEQAARTRPGITPDTNIAAPSAASRPTVDNNMVGRMTARSRRPRFPPAPRPARLGIISKIYIIATPLHPSHRRRLLPDNSGPITRRRGNTVRTSHLSSAKSGWMTTSRRCRTCRGA